MDFKVFRVTDSIFITHQYDLWYKICKIWKITGSHLGFEGQDMVTSIKWYQKCYQWPSKSYNLSYIILGITHQCSFTSKIKFVKSKG